MCACVWGGGSLICAGGLGINSGALLRQPAWYILIDRRQTGGRNIMTERERFFFPPAAHRHGRGECKGAQTKRGLICEEELPLSDVSTFFLFVGEDADVSASPLSLLPTL